jgi:mannosyltransferase OCH1-like enzyme
MPAEFAAYGDMWRVLHPGWKVCEWGDDLPAGLQQADVFARAVEVCPYDRWRFEADVLRLQLLWEFGGVYVDTDVEPLRALDPLLVGVECFASWSPHRGPGDRRLLTNAVLGASPRHPFIGACLDGLTAAIEKFRARPLAQMIGPWHLTRVFEARPEGVTVFDECVFSPQHNRDRDRGASPNLSGAYAHHKWATSRDRRR